MKLFRTGLFFILPAFSLFITSCTAPLLYEKTAPEIKAPADKALCVVIRHTKIFGNYSPFWVDSKLVSGTTGGTITTFEVDPGSHLIITKVSIKAKVKLNFQAGKVYYILQTAYAVPLIGVMTSLCAMPANEAVEILEKEKGSIKYSRTNPAFDQKDLTEKDVNAENTDYTEWAAKNPEKAKAEAEYPGY
jgi:hypothetical protein